MKNFNFDLILNEFCKPESVVTITISKDCYLLDISSQGLLNREGDLPHYLDDIDLDDNEKLKVIGVDQYD